MQTDNKTAPRPVVLEGTVALLDGFDASQLLRNCNTVIFIWSGKLKQLKARLMSKYVGICISKNRHSRTYKTASRNVGLKGVSALLDGYDAS